jgi:hypothetical protein
MSVLVRFLSLFDFGLVEVAWHPYSEVNVILLQVKDSILASKLVYM